MSQNKAIWKIRDRYFSVKDHPYPVFERKIMDSVSANDTVLELGCGRFGGLLATLKGKAKLLIGVDQCDCYFEDDSIYFVNNNIEKMTDIKNYSIDIIYSRSVMEHIQDTDAAYCEIYRVLKNNGVYIFLTPNIFDYLSIISFIVPNKFHASIVKFLEGREEHDTFPTYYRSNSRRRIYRLANKYGLYVEEFLYLGQYPNYFLFNRFLFWLGCKYDYFLQKHPRLWFLRGWILCTLRKT